MQGHAGGGKTTRAALREKAERQMAEAKDLREGGGVRITNIRLNGEDVVISYEILED